MARSLTAIYDALALEKSTFNELSALQPDIDTSQTLLNDLDSTSQVAKWRLMLWVVAVCVWAHEKLWDVFRAEVEELAKASHVGTPRWYVQKSLEYQHGYALEDINGVFTYSIDDQVARIVKRAAVVEQGGTVLLKVAKEAAGVLQPLDTVERDAFEAYIDEIKMAGTVVNVLTAGPDYLKLLVDVYYDPLVMAPDGSLILNGGVKPVEDAINAHLASLPFNGALVLTALVDSIQAAQGVVNPVLREAQARYGGFPLQAIDVQYVAYAGYMTVDPFFPLATSITYIPYGV
ncbi:MAG TPA: hypothetical protein PKE21_13885 [Flavobacteriales bacterium]|nr:hypothetical protein [Flavobacteriales bacterium]HMR28568.1 hypothetical protein [Flavobacteriales bacterium]